MKMSQVINSIEFDAFRRCMNQPEEGFDGIAAVKTFADGSRWAVCPWCGKKAVRVLPDTKIQHMPYKCKGSNCKKEFIIEENWRSTRLLFIKGCRKLDLKEIFMKIEVTDDARKKNIAQVRGGECFQLDGHLYMKLSENSKYIVRNTTFRYAAVDLESNTLNLLSDYAEVNVVEAKIVIEKVEE